VPTKSNPDFADCAPAEFSQSRHGTFGEIPEITGRTRTGINATRSRIFGKLPDFYRLRTSRIRWGARAVSGKAFGNATDKIA
jgi:hypothetical protein